MNIKEQILKLQETLSEENLSELMDTKDIVVLDVIAVIQKDVSVAKRDLLEYIATSRDKTKKEEYFDLLQDTLKLESDSKLFISTLNKYLKGKLNKSKHLKEYSSNRSYIINSKNNNEHKEVKCVKTEKKETVSKNKRDYYNNDWYKDLKNTEQHCIYCEEELTKETFTVDHIVPLKDGGENSEENCKPCCKFCNTLKDDMSYVDFIKEYPKERLVKLKEITNSNLDLNGAIMAERFVNITTQIDELISKLISERDEVFSIKNTYNNLSKKSREEIAYSVKASASDGYKMYAKSREIERNNIRYENEYEFIKRYDDGINLLKKTNQEMLKSATDSLIGKKSSTKGLKVRKLDDDIRIIEDNKQSLNIKVSNGEKIYKFDSSSHVNKNKHKSLCFHWDSVEKDDINKVFICKGKKNR